MKSVVYVYVRPAEDGFFAECFDLPVSAEARSLDEVLDVIQDSIQQYMNDNDPLRAGFVSNPEVLVTMHMGLPLDE
ncbi:MAG: hypothetical protein O2968_01815 [Acidobacteria bacterium]|nr:hypothetical protein [Acidobacteriota bacterium]